MSVRCSLLSILRVATLAMLNFKADMCVGHGKRGLRGPYTEETAGAVGH